MFKRQERKQKIISYSDYQVTKSASHTMTKREGSREREKVTLKAAAFRASVMAG